MHTYKYMMNFDVSVESDEQAKKIVEVMENAVKLEVPIRLTTSMVKIGGQ